MGPGVSEGAQVKGKKGKQVGMIPGLTSGRSEEDLAGGKHASVWGPLGEPLVSHCFQPGCP